MSVAVGRHVTIQNLTRYEARGEAINAPGRNLAALANPSPATGQGARLTGHLEAAWEKKI